MAHVAIDVCMHNMHAAGPAFVASIIDRNTRCLSCSTLISGEAAHSMRMEQKGAMLGLTTGVLDTYLHPCPSPMHERHADQYLSLERATALHTAAVAVVR